jgi:hypothetical protein
MGYDIIDIFKDCLIAFGSALAGSYSGVRLTEKNELRKLKKRENDNVDSIEQEIQNYQEFIEISITYISSLITSKEVEKKFEISTLDNYLVSKEKLSNFNSDLDDSDLSLCSKIDVALHQFIPPREWCSFFLFNNSSLIREGHDFFSEKSAISKYGFNRYSYDFKRQLMILQSILVQISDISTNLCSKDNSHKWTQFFVLLIKLRNQIKKIQEDGLINSERSKISETQ